MKKLRDGKTILFKCENIDINLFRFDTTNQFTFRHQFKTIFPRQPHIHIYKKKETESFFILFDFQSMNSRRRQKFIKINGIRPLFPLYFHSDELINKHSLDLKRRILGLGFNSMLVGLYLLDAVGLCLVSLKFSAKRFFFLVISSYRLFPIFKNIFTFGFATSFTQLILQGFVYIA